MSEAEGSTIYVLAKLFSCTLNVTPHILYVLSKLFKRAVKRNDQLIEDSQQQPRQPPAAAAFSGWSERSSSTCISGYLFHIFLNMNCKPCHYVLAFIYIDRFLHLNPTVLIDSLNVRRFIITALLVAVKFADQWSKEANAYFARVGGITAVKMNQLEANFLSGLGFDLSICPKVYSDCCSFLLREMSTLNPKATTLLQLYFTFEEERGFPYLIKAFSAGA